MMANKEALRHDYRRVRLEEYASAAAFSVGFFLFGYGAFEGLRNDQNTFSTILCSYLAVGSGLLARSSFEQGRVMSREASKLEKELENSSQNL